ncbi:YciI family protein [uncultured Shewanella sp.]|uniref:YciI family protein n=1 Tax=Shewanella atlantica TaxID=271099 RepID=UPI00260A1707|nr:YciI family protein [uncultured Shewanella sp.]
MKQFIYQLFPTRVEMLSEGADARESLILDDHFNYLKGLKENEVVLMAGRTLTQDKSTFGIVILEVESESAAEAIMHRDPVVEKGVMKAVLSPFRVAI